VPGYDNDVPGKPGGVPDTLLGDPIQVNQDVAVMAANAKSILYGDFSYYTIRDALDVQMFRFIDSAYASRGRSASSPSCARRPVRRCRRLGQILPEQRDLRAASLRFERSRRPKNAAGLLSPSPAIAGFRQGQGENEHGR
jgi:hypothetical protein